MTKNIISHLHTGEKHHVLSLSAAKQALLLFKLYFSKKVATWAAFSKFAPNKEKLHFVLNKEKF